MSVNRTSSRLPTRRPPSWKYTRLESFGRDLLELGVAGADFLGVEEAGGVLRGQGDGQVPDAVLVRRPDRRGVAHAGAGIDDDAARAGRLLPAFARICGCQRFFTSRSRRAASSGRGFLIWSFTYRSTVRWEIRSIWATASARERSWVRGG